MAAYLKYVQVLKGAFVAFELVHVPRDQNARADLLGKLASSGKGRRQRTVIQETLKAPRTFAADNRVDILHVCTTRGKPKSHQSLSQDTVRVPNISDENQIKEAFINGGRGHPPSHLKFFLLVFSKLKEDIK